MNLLNLMIEQVSIIGMIYGHFYLQALVVTAFSAIEVIRCSHFKSSSRSELVHY